MNLLISALVWAFGIAYAIAGWFGIPNWARALIVILVLVWIVVYIIITKRNDRRNVTGEELDDQLEHDGKPYLTTREAIANAFGAHYEYRSPFERLYRDGHH